METPHRIIVEHLLQERRSQAAAERLAASRPHGGARETMPRRVSGPTGRRLLGSHGSASVDSCGVPQRAG